jgi:HPt (histidine-containing phosphotransfer) domain-containing protein
MTDPIDDAAFAQTIELTGGDREFLADLVSTYRTDGQARIAEMRSALAAGDATLLQRAAHTLKSSSATLGAVALADRCRAVEFAARDGQLEGLEEAIDEIAAGFERAGAALATKAGIDG